MGAISGTTIASGLNYPYGMAVTTDGNIPFGESNPLIPSGIMVDRPLAPCLVLLR